MTEIERMKRYIERTKIETTDRYCLMFGEAMALSHHEEMDGFVNAIETAFNYGRAKERRKAQREAARK